ncbi:hypothetical protein I4F81_008471 [Pyropia yezoensis]|uniref:Uncharacterized protein n=1 Tax=Pyropia yezoensis TaxID=2788 RepID=A0ACC3C6V1_PYRYE|nr:hypothetical protein I4F81_008471 [Neopyropia yezoensis]
MAPRGRARAASRRRWATSSSARLVPVVFARAVAEAVSPAAFFSHWFSESAKRMTALFRSIRAAAADGTTLVVVVADEVESLSTTRLGKGGEGDDGDGDGGGGSGGDLVDAMRLVNALLTQLDTLRRVPNVPTPTTSNLPSAVDAAFVDRADSTAYVGLPSVAARRAVLASTVGELSHAGLLAPDHGSDDAAAAASTASAAAASAGDAPRPPALGERAAAALDAAAAAAAGLSGRALWRLLLLAATAAPAASLSFWGGGAAPVGGGASRLSPTPAWGAYTAHFSSSGAPAARGYAGVAMYVRDSLAAATAVTAGVGWAPADAEGRCLTARLPGGRPAVVGV